MLKKSKLFLSSILFILTLPSYGGELFGRPFNYGGTASVYFNTSDKNFFKSKDNPFHYSQATLFGSYSLFNNLSLRGEVALLEGEPRLNYLLADISRGNLSTLYGVRVGKYQRYGLLYDDVRFNPTRRRFIYLPTTVYFPAIEEFVTAATGAQIYARKALFNNRGSISLQIDRGVPLFPAKTSVEHEFSQIYGGQEIDDIDAFEYGASTFISSTLEYRNWRVVLLYNPDTSWEYTSTNHPVIPMNNAEQEIWSGGIEYRNNKWLFAVDGFYTTIKTEFPTLPLSASDLTATAYSVTLGYDITDRLQLSAFTSQIFLETRSDVFTTGTIQRVTTNLTQRDSAISARYYLTKNWALRAEGHYFNGNPINLLGFGSDNEININDEEDWTLFTMGIEYKF